MPLYDALANGLTNAAITLHLGRRPDSLIGLAGNHVDASVVKPSETISQVKAGVVKAIGVFSTTRVEAMPELPTFVEKNVNIFPYG